MSSDCVSEPKILFLHFFCTTKNIYLKSCAFSFVSVNSFVRTFEDKLVLLWSEFLLQLHYLRLPKDISEDYVILMDSTVSTGAAALMAVRVLLVSHLSSPVIFI